MDTEIIMSAIDDDFDALCLKLGVNEDPFMEMLDVPGNPVFEGMLKNSLFDHRAKAMRGTNALANLIQVIAIQHATGQPHEDWRKAGRELRRALIVASGRLVGRFGLSEVNRRAAAVAKMTPPMPIHNPCIGLPTDVRTFYEAMGVEGGMPPEMIFFSWQSDSPKKTNWNFIEDALERAIKVVNKGGEFKLEPSPDRDTKDVAGSPSIADTIFQKIRDCAVFVSDITIVNGTHPEPRHMPNPNVLFEAGYALAHKDWDRVIFVANTAYGRVEDLPFDIRGRRIMKYNLPEDAAEKAEERGRLAETLADAIRLALKARKQV